MISDQSRDLVRYRAAYRCEYCRVAEASIPFFPRHHVDHVIPKQHGGSDELENLALACRRCNASKGPNLSGVDPTNGTIVTLFNPRRASWHEHFEIQAGQVFGLTATGRATARTLAMNEPDLVELRALTE